MPIPIRESAEVALARRENRPVVGLESTILAHGLPRPRNYDVVRRCEDIVRTHGAAPATLAFRDGGLRVGLEQAELEELSKDESALKVNLSNLAASLARPGWGATTVSASLWACARAGLRVLVTGGIGGVHRGFHETFDISSDLLALARFPVLLVGSGVKSLLDVGATREHLETQGVPVLGWRTDYFPRFYLPRSQWKVDTRVETAEEAARIAMLHWEAGGAALLLAVPIPEDEALAEEELEEALAAAEFERKTTTPPVEGREVTPFLLARLHRHTRGKSFKANVALFANNTLVGAQMALALAK